MNDAFMTKSTVDEYLIRHEPADRIFHWVMAMSTLVLLGTGFLPILGLKFSWVVPHWIAGLVLIFMVLLHIARSISIQKLRNIGIGFRDLKDLWLAYRVWRGTDDSIAPKPGKYSLAQRLYHNVIALFVIAVCITGGLMMVKQDTPLWKRNPYWLADSDWGLIYVIHGLAAILILSMLLIHIYFAFRPEKLWYTRSMIKGWITRSEYEKHHDPSRWEPESEV